MEVVRTQSRDHESIAELIQALGRVFDREPARAGGAMEFVDTDFVDEPRDAMYQARVLAEHRRRSCAEPSRRV